METNEFKETVEVVDLSEHLSKPTQLPPDFQSEPTEETDPEPPTEDEETADIPTVDVPEDYPEEETADEPQRPNFLDSNTLSMLIASGNQAILPPFFIGGYKKILFKKGEFEAVQEVLTKQKEANKKGENYEATKKELKLLTKYHQYCDFRDNKAELTEDQIFKLQEAWAYQLNKWGFDDVNLNINPLLQVYTGIAIEKGTNIIGSKLSNNG